MKTYKISVLDEFKWKWPKVMMNIEYEVEDGENYSSNIDVANDVYDYINDYCEDDWIFNNLTGLDPEKYKNVVEKMSQYKDVFEKADYLNTQADKLDIYKIDDEDMQYLFDTVSEKDDFEDYVKENPDYQEKVQEDYHEAKENEEDLEAYYKGLAR